MDVGILSKGEAEELRERVRERYSQSALRVQSGSMSGGCCGSEGESGCCTGNADPITANLYTGQETGEVPVFPTPTIGMVGIIADKNNIMTLDFKQKGDSIFLLGKSQNDIASSEYLYSYHKVKNTPAPFFNLDEEYEVQKAVKTLSV